MSFAKYSQLYKDNGFYVGSKIKATVTDSTFIGEELVLSKGNDVIRSITIPASGKVNFFTDESGTLTLSADNGISVISGIVEITNYSTYYVTLNGVATDNQRDAYAKDVTMDKATATANVSYTGDIAPISIVVTDPSLVRATVNGNKINITDAGNDMQGKTSITATVASTKDYTSAEVTFNVNKLTGIYGSWEDATNEVIANMIAKADAGEIDLADFWNIGDTRRVHLNAVEAGSSLIVSQPEQEIELVLMHYTQNSGKYVLTVPLASGRKTHPSYAIGLKNCLENRSSISFIQKSFTQNGVTYPNEYITSTLNFPYFNSEESEVESWLNNNMYESLPNYIKQSLKGVNVRFVGSRVLQGNIKDSYDVLYIRTTGTAKSQKIVLPSVYEICEDNITITSSGSQAAISGNSVYRAEKEGNWYRYGNSMLLDTFDYSYEGELFSYCVNTANRKKKRGNTSFIPYLTRTFTHWHTGYHTLTDQIYYDTNAIINENGTVGTYSLDDTTEQNLQRGISPIMFI